MIFSSPALADESWQPDQVSGWPVITQRTAQPQQQVTSGVEYSSENIQTVSGRQPVEELDSDLKNPNVSIRTVAADDKVVNPADETVSSMANRTGSVAGINGGFFAINASGEPTDGEIINGEIYKSPKNIDNASFAVDGSGNVSFAGITFSGTIADGAQTHSLASINWESDATGDGITEITPRLGQVDAQYLGGTRLIVLGTSNDNGASIKVTSIQTADHLAQLTAGTYGLLSSDAPSAGGAWIRNTVHVGDTLSMNTKVNGGTNIKQLVEGSYRIIANGKANQDSAGESDSGSAVDPRVAVGTTDDGHLIMVTMDGHQTTSKAVGVTMAQLTSYLLSKGVTNAIQLDCGGSAQMVARDNGNSTVSVKNTPSDGQERPVINGIFLYSNAPDNGRSQAVHINGGNTIQTAVGATTPLSVYATDAAGNTTNHDKPSVTVSPSDLGTWSSGYFNAKKAGNGTLTVTMGDAVANEPIDVEQQFDSLTISPSDLDVTNGGQGTLSITGTINGQTTTVDKSSVTWKVSDTKLGSINQQGVFTGAAEGSGLDTVTAVVGTRTASTQIAVGTAHQTVDTVDNAKNWALKYYGGTTGDSAFSDDTADHPSGQSSSIKASYDMPGTPGVHQLVMWPNNTVTIDKNGQGVSPTSITVWVKIDDPVHSAFEICVSFIQSNGQTTNEYIPNLSYGTWTPVTVNVPSGASLPLTMNFVDLLSIRPTAESKGTIHIGSITGDYSPRPASAYTYSGIANNPSWLTFKESANEFSAGGTTYLMGDDAHLLANDQNSASATNLRNIAKRVNGESYVTDSGQTVQPLSSVATPTVVQMLGDMADNGDLDNLQFAQSLIAGIGAPYHDLVGNHEDTQGTISEADHFASVFGDTHYSYRSGQSTFIALDNSHGGVTSSDANQSPVLPQGQYSWLIDQLSQASTSTVIVGIHMPAYDPFPAQNSEFSDRWEAQQFLQIIQNYQNAHPNRHIMVVYGHARGFSEQILNPEGESVTGSSGIAQFTFADLGMPAYSTPSQGGFYHFGLVHVNNNGTVEFAVEPLLSMLSIDQGTAEATKTNSGIVKLATVTKTDTLQAGATKQYSATGVSQQGDNSNPAISLPITDPVSHVWSSSDSSIASIDKVSGLLTAHKAGSVTVSITTGGITASSALTVAPVPSNPGTKTPGNIPNQNNAGQSGTTGSTSSAGNNPTSAQAANNGTLANTGSNVGFAGILGLLLLGISLITFAIRKE
jgi:exopolysaccharide biosynthesis protein